MMAFGMTREDRTRLRTATILAAGFYLVLFLAMLGVKPPVGGASAQAGGATITVELEGNPQATSVTHGEGAAPSGSAAGRPSAEPSAASGGTSLASSSQPQSAPANPFALPPGIDLSGEVVAASSGALEANQVPYGRQSATPASSAAMQAAPAAPSAPAAVPGELPSAPAQSPEATGQGSADAARLPAGAAPGGAFGGAAPAAPRTTAGGGGSAPGPAAARGAGPDVFDQATLALALGQQGAGYGGGSGSRDASGSGGGGSGPQAAAGGTAGGAAAGGPAGLLSAPGASGDGGFPIQWSVVGGRQPKSEPPPLDLGKYADTLPPRAVVIVHFEVSPSGYVTPLQLDGSSGNTVVDSLLLGWMGKWTFSPVSGTRVAQGSLKYIIQATTAR